MLHVYGLTPKVSADIPAISGLQEIALDLPVTGAQLEAFRVHSSAIPPLKHLFFYMKFRIYYFISGS